MVGEAAVAALSSRVHVVTHLLASWDLGAASGQTRRDLAAVAWAGVLPDLDGVGLFVDAAAKRLGLGETEFYAWHHAYGHGLPAMLAIAALAALVAVHKWRTALLAFAAANLHLACDLLGSRGVRPEDVWEISYLSPLSHALHFTWSGQWPVVSWQNTTISAALLILAVVVTVWRGVSPVGLVSARADRAVAETLRARWLSLTGSRDGPARRA
jgi:hypothetical protein